MNNKAIQTYHEEKEFLSKKPKGHKLSYQEEYNLAVSMKTGDIKARNKLVLAHTPLLAHIAKKFKGHDQSELIQIGTLGLINAAEGFNPELGYRFSTYARKAAEDAMKNHIIRNWSVTSKGINTKHMRLFFLNYHGHSQSLIHNMASH